MKVIVFGLPGMKTQQALINVTAAATEIDPSIVVEWISDASGMLEFDVRRTPTVMVGESVRFAGRVPSIHELTVWFQEILLVEA